MSRALACIADPPSYAGTGYCTLDCASGEIEIGPEELTQPVGVPSAHCSSGVGDAVCVVSCVGTEPRVEVVPEPDPFGSLAFGALLVAALVRC